MMYNVHVMCVGLGVGYLLRKQRYKVGSPVRVCKYVHLCVI